MRRLVLSCSAAAAVLAFALSGCSGSTSGPAASAPATAPSSGGTSRATGNDWPMYHRSADRAGVATDMPRVRGVRLAASIKLDAAVYASPIIVDGLTIVATENDTVYAFDADNRQVWKRHLGTPAHSTELPCGNIDPLGITGTPVYDPSTKSVDVAAEFGSPVRHALISIGLRDGRVRWQRSLDLPGVETKAVQERGALTITGNRVWVPFGGLAGDCGGYKGRVIGYALNGTGAPVSYTVPTEREAGIWTPPGPTVDRAGDLLVAVGNGASGVGDRYDHSDSVLRISPKGKLADSFSPRSWATDNEADKDLGSMGPILVGQWVLTAGKSGNGYVLRADRLGGIGGQVSSGALCRAFGGSAVSTGIAYVPCIDGVRAVRIDSAGKAHVLWHAKSTVVGSPVVAGGFVWSLNPYRGVLNALDPRTGKVTFTVSVGNTSRFATPAVSGSHLYVPTLSGLAVVGTS